MMKNYLYFLVLAVSMSIFFYLNCKWNLETEKLQLKTWGMVMKYGLKHRDEKDISPKQRNKRDYPYSFIFTLLEKVMSLMGDDLLEEFWRLNEQWIEAAPQYEQISQNEFSHRKHKRQKEEDIAICECQYDLCNPESACGESCLNALTSTECSPGYCRCGIYCRNQRFQKCEYAKTKLCKTEGRGWGLLADEDIKKGKFIIEYCGEVISWKEARRRSQAYEKQGLKDAFIISLNSSESIDATRKGSLARFINHSCQPNCETRKWNVLGEIRVGIFAKQHIPIGTELTYDYNFEWYGGAKVRCLCGAVSCSGFLGAKSRGFQEDTYLWEDDDVRYSVEKIPLYDSAEDDEPAAKIPRILDSNSIDDINPSLMNFSVRYENQLESSPPILQPMDSVPVESVVMNPVKVEPYVSMELYSLHDVQQELEQKHAIVPLPCPDVGNDGTSQNYRIGSRPLLKIKKQQKRKSKVKSKIPMQKEVDAKYVVERLALKEAQDEVLIHEEMMKEARSQLSSLYDEIRPAIEQHESDNQDSVATSVAEKWIEACCAELKAEFDLYSSIIKNVACTPRKMPQLLQPPQQITPVDNEVKYLDV